MSARHAVHVIGSGDSDARGIAHTIFNLARFAEPHRYRLSAICLRNDGPVARDLRQAGVETRVLDWHGGGADISGALSFARALRRLRPDIVHLHAGGLSPRIVSRAAVGARVVAHYHSLEEETVAARGKRSSLGADAVIANSEATASTIPDAGVRVIHPGLDVPPVPSRSPNSHVTIGVAARLAPVKGIIHLIEALDILRASHPDLMGVIAGDGPERRHLESSVRSMKLDGRVRFTGWIDDVIGEMAGWDVYCQPSLAEGLGIAALEAMSVALPVVASDVGGLREIIVNDSTGILVAPRDARALARAIGTLADDAQLRSEMGEAGRKRVIDCFPVEREASAIASVYDEILA